MASRYDNATAWAEDIINAPQCADTAKDDYYSHYLSKERQLNIYLAADKKEEDASS